MVLCTTKNTKDTKKVLENKSLDAPFQHLNVEVDQQPNVCLGEFHVRQNLRLVNFEQLIYALQLNDQPTINQQVYSVSAIKVDLFVFNRQFNLKPKRDPRLIQLVSQALLVSRFKQARPKFPVHLDRTPKNLVRQVIKLHFLLRVPFVLFVCFVVNTCFNLLRIRKRKQLALLLLRRQRTHEIPVRKVSDGFAGFGKGPCDIAARINP